MKNSFLHNVAEDLIRRSGGLSGLREYTLVFPMRRGGLAIQRELEKILREQGVRTIILPRMLTIDELCDSLTTLRPDDELHSVIDLYHLYLEEISQSEHVGEPMTLDVFYGWGKQLLSDFSDVDMALLNADTLFSNSIEAHTLEDLIISDETRARLEELMPKNPNRPALDAESRRMLFEQFWHLIPKLYHRLLERHAKQGVGYRGARYRQVVEHFDAPYAAERTRGQKYAFIGFNYLLDGERKLMTLLRDRALYYWDYNATFSTNADAYKFIKAEQTNLPNALPASCERNEGLEAREPIRLAAATGTSTQAQYVHDWLTEHHSKGENTAVIIADESMLEPVVFALPGTVANEVNITKGFPLRDTQIYGDIVRYLSDSGLGQKAQGDWSHILKDLLLSIEPKEERVAEESVAPLDNDSPQDDQTPESATWQQILRKEAYHQAKTVINRFITLLEDGTLNDVQDLHTLRNLIRRCLDMVSMPFHGEPMVDVQVMGVLESRVLDFDHLLILNAEEGVLPRTPVNNSFVPYYLRKYHHMQTSDEESAIYAYNFFRLLRRCPDCTILFSSGATGTSRRTMSRFLMQLLISGEYPIQKMRLTESDTVDTGEINVFDGTPTQPILSLSPSAINTYLGCRRRFYLEYMLGLRETAQSETIFTNADLGNLVHGILKCAYEEMAKGLFPHEVSKAEITAFLKDNDRISRAVDGAYRDMNENYAHHHRNAPDTDCHYRREEHPVENDVAILYVRKVLEHDATLPYLKIVLMEKKHYIHIPVELPDGKIVSVRIGGTIDRLDVVEEGGSRHLRVLDYKTGSYDQSKMKADSTDALMKEGTKQTYMLQTLIYCLVCLEQTETLNPEQLPVMPSLLFTTQDLTDFDPRLQLMGNYITDFATCRDEFYKRLQKLVQDIVNCTEFDMCKQSECKSYCPFHLLCGREKEAF